MLSASLYKNTRRQAAKYCTAIGTSQQDRFTGQTVLAFSLTSVQIRKCLYVCEGFECTSTRLEKYF